MAEIYYPGTAFRKGSPFGRRKHPITGVLGAMHYGQDWPAKAEIPIKAAAKGKVIISKFDYNAKTKKGFGNYIVLEHFDQRTNQIVHTFYAHMIRLSPIPIGRTVDKGAVIGHVGTTGGSTGEHLHFEIRVGCPKGYPFPSKQSVDPAKYDISGLTDVIGKVASAPTPTPTQKKTEQPKPVEQLPVPEPINNSISSDFKFPVCKADGSEYTAEELMGLLADEGSGHYLLGAHQFWHGGIHISDEKFPHCVKDSPVRAISQGEVVAYRLNKDYEQISDESEGQKYNYSTSFCLVQHTYKSPEKISDATDKMQQWVGKKVILSKARNARSVPYIKLKSPGDYVSLFPANSRFEILGLAQEAVDGYYFIRVKMLYGNRATGIDGKTIILEDGCIVYMAGFTPDGNVATDGGQKVMAPYLWQPEDVSETPKTYELSYYSLYMHLCSYNDYLGAAEADAKKTITIKADQLRARDKARSELDCQVIGYISNGATLEVLETTKNGTITDIRGKIITGTVTNKGVPAKKAGDEVWVPTNDGSNTFIAEPKQRSKPTYWEGIVTAKVKNSNGLTIWKEFENKTLTGPAGTINQGNLFTFESTKTKCFSKDGKLIQVAQCKPKGGLTFRSGGEQLESFWTTVDSESSIIREEIVPTIFNEVVHCYADTMVAAGDALGYLGLYETPQVHGEKKTKRQAHVEVFTAYKQGVEELLNNPLGLKGGRQYIRLPKGTKLIRIAGSAQPENSGQIVAANAPSTAMGGGIGGGVASFSAQDILAGQQTPREGAGKAIGGIVGSAIPAQGKIGKVLSENLASGVEGVISGTQTGKEAVEHIVGQTLGTASSSMGKVGEAIGGDVASGLEGIVSGTQTLKEAATNLTDNLVDEVLGINTPNIIVDGGFVGAIDDVDSEHGGYEFGRDYDYESHEKYANDYEYDENGEEIGCLDNPHIPDIIGGNPSNQKDENWGELIGKTIGEQIPGGKRVSRIGGAIGGMIGEKIYNHINGISSISNDSLVIGGGIGGARGFLPEGNVGAVGDVDGSQIPTGFESNDAPPAPTQNTSEFTLQYNHVFPIDTLKIEKDAAGKEWYFIATEKQSGKIAKTPTTPEVVSQYDWKKLGFQIVEENDESADGYLDLEAMPDFFKEIYHKMNTDGKGGVSQAELKAALNDSDLSEQWSKLIALHPTEWREDNEDIKERMKSLLLNESNTDITPERGQELFEQECQRIDKLSFWGDLLTGSEASYIPKKIYHFHPVLFIDHIRSTTNPTLTNVVGNTIGIVTFHIFHDGRIEKHIPSKIQAGYENKYQYIYHDKSGNTHEVCTVDKHTTKKKANGVWHKKIPSTAGVLSDKNVQDGDTRRRINYSNGNIAEYGKHGTYGHGWQFYKALNIDVELIKMPDILNYSKNGVNVKFKFAGSNRRYTGPGPFAGFIGALAETGYTITSTGSCFSGASCFPSVSHVNGESVDTRYLHKAAEDKNFIRAMKKFHFTERLVGVSDYCKLLLSEATKTAGKLHDTHLHSGKFSHSIVTIVNGASIGAPTKVESPSNTGDRVNINQLSLSQKGRAFIKEWENFSSKPYNDSEGYCTIGYGHLIARKRCENITIPAKFAKGVTKQEASLLFEERVPGFERNVRALVKTPLYQHEFDALVSLTFNCGSLIRAPNLVRNLNSSNYKGAAHEFLDITNGGAGGLVKRRRSENNMFLNNIYDASH